MKGAIFFSTKVGANSHLPFSGAQSQNKVLAVVAN